MKIKAIYENNVLKPLGDLNLPNKALVSITIIGKDEILFACLAGWPTGFLLRAQAGRRAAPHSKMWRGNFLHTGSGYYYQEYGYYYDDYF